MISSITGVMVACVAIILADNWQTRRSVRNMVANLDDRFNGWISRCDDLLERLDDE